MFNVGTAPGQNSLKDGFDPVFGPRGRSPVEKDELLTLEQVARLALSGALCASSAHVVLTPFEVVKTRMQLAPDGTYSSVSPRSKVQTK